MEYLEVRNKDGSKTGQVKSRDKVHQDGDIHGTSHVWIIRNLDEKLEVLLQLRSEKKDSYPNCYDISSAGHIPSGFDFLDSAIRELEEELGINADKSDLKYIGMHFGQAIANFYGKEFINNEISAVYIYDKSVEVDQLKLQKEEVQAVRWFDYEECLEKIKSGDPNFCIFLDEFLMLRDKVSLIYNT